MSGQNRKCGECGLVHFVTDEQCRRCGAVLLAAESTPTADATSEPTVVRRVIGVSALIVLLLILAYSSLIVSSAGLTTDQQHSVDEALMVMERVGFTTEATTLRRIVSFRSTDSWWNSYVGHRSAYASTNFPFAVVTVYPAFFDLAVDETERAMILLHEAHHVFGAGEESALRQVWIEKERLGWTSDRYGDTRVWKNTREWTARSAPELFTP